MPEAPIPLSSSARALWRLLEQRESVSSAEASEQLGVGARQVLRLVRALQASGVSVEEASRSRKRVYRLGEGEQALSLGGVMLTAGEALALRVAAQAADAVIGSTPLGNPARSAFAKIGGALGWDGETAATWYVSDLAQAPIDPDVLAALLEGMSTLRGVVIDYAKAGGETSRRTVNPLCILIRERAVALAAWCRMRDGYRFFALTRIESATLCDPSSDAHPYFRRPDDFDPDTFFRPDEHGAFTEGEPDRFSLLVEPDVAHLFHEKDYRMLQQIDEERADGRIVVSYEGSGFDEWRSFFQSWGTNVTVLEPGAMRERLAHDAAVLVERYAQGDSSSDAEMSALG